MSRAFFPDRRNFLRSTAAAAALAAAPLPLRAALAAERPPFRLTAGTFAQPITADGPGLAFWGFNGQCPGPLLRYRRGDHVRVVYRNALPAPSAVHWHGIRVPNAMDGVPFVTQDPVAPGDEFVYDFALRDSGTFWYHPHQNSFEQVPRGLYGAFIVDEDKPPAVDEDLVWVVSDIKLGPDGQVIEDYGRILDLANDGRLGNRVLINGELAGEARTIAARRHRRLRLRLINAASARVFNLALSGHDMQVIAYDGQAVTPHVPEVLTLGPGMRADLIIDCKHDGTGSFPLTDTGHRGMGEIGRLVYADGKAQRSKPLADAVRLAGNNLPEPDLAKATDHYVVFAGGMRGTPVIGVVDGKPSRIQDIMERQGLAWTMNYTAEHEHALMHEPLLYLKPGEHVVLRMINETDYAHPMHLHGHFFRVVAIDGRKTRHQEWRDTVMMSPRQTVDIAFVADNPGHWMFHCHILDHAAGGMMGTIAVE